MLKSCFSYQNRNRSPWRKIQHVAVGVCSPCKLCSPYKAILSVILQNVYMNMVCIIDAKECCPSGFPTSGNRMLAEVTPPVRYSRSNFTFHCCLESYFLKHREQSGTHLSENTRDSLPGTSLQGMLSTFLWSFSNIKQSHMVNVPRRGNILSSIFSSPWKFWKGRPECAWVNGVIVGIRAGNFQVMVSNELHSRWSIKYVSVCLHLVYTCGTDVWECMGYVDGFLCAVCVYGMCSMCVWCVRCMYYVCNVCIVCMGYVQCVWCVYTGYIIGVCSV